MQSSNSIAFMLKPAKENRTYELLSIIHEPIHVQKKSHTLAQATQKQKPNSQGLYYYQYSDNILTVFSVTEFPQRWGGWEVQTKDSGLRGCGFNVATTEGSVLISMPRLFPHNLLTRPLMWNCVCWVECVTWVWFHIHKNTPNTLKSAGRYPCLFTCSNYS